jgi:uncharacterized protein (DUF924 family)
MRSRAFRAEIELALSGRLADWSATREGTLALILLWISSRGMSFAKRRGVFRRHRGALTCACAGSFRRDREFAPIERWFVYMPFEHAENLVDQYESVRLFQSLADAGLADPLTWAVKHFEVIRRFGRFRIATPYWDAPRRSKRPSSLRSRVRASSPAEPCATRWLESRVFALADRSFMASPRILAVDTATDTCSVCAPAGRPGRSRSEAVGQRYSERALSMIDALLNAAGLRLEEVDLIAFGAGPGSFTGLRIACGLAQGLAWGIGRPVVPVGNLWALAERVFASPRPATGSCARLMRECTRRIARSITAARGSAAQPPSLANPRISPDWQTRWIRSRAMR